MVSVGAKVASMVSVAPAPVPVAIILLDNTLPTRILQTLSANVRVLGHGK
jgi:hypothetical protein